VVSDSHLVIARSAAVEAHQVAFAGVPPIVPLNQAGEAIDQPHDGLQVIRGDCPSCCGAGRASATYATLISNKIPQWFPQRRTTILCDGC
jgi:hypothetical protein